MTRYLLEPEVAGELGPDTEMDSSTHPPRVTRLQYEMHGWLGDDIVESFPCFVVTKKLADLLTEANLTGFTLAPVDVTISDEAEELEDGSVDLPEFLWLQPGSDSNKDLSVDSHGVLVVTEQALEVMRQTNLANCDIEEYEG